jgi:6-phosphogluconolactonase
MVHVYSYEDSFDVANAVARYILKVQDETLATKPTFDVAVSGGSLGKVLRGGLIGDPVVFGKIQWSKWRVFFSDERLVPLEHEDSNYGLLNEMVLKELAHQGVNGPTVFTINESLLHETDTTTDNEIAKEYASFLPDSLDLVLLGAGPDGHTCSLFPEHKLLNEQTLTVAAIADSPKPPPRRITITFPVLEKAKNIAFVAEGAGKAPVFKKIFGAEKSGLPCELVNELSVPVSWFVNSPAIEGVPVNASKY